jgi:type I restriction enzyme S subunit
MKLNYRQLGEYVHEINDLNHDLKANNLIGVSMNKTFIPSVANIIGVDLSSYKIIKKNQLACKLMSVGRDEKLPVDLYKDENPSIISPAYFVFESIDQDKLLPQYLMMWLCRPENDRYIGFISGGDVRGGISWDDFCKLQINIPSKSTQEKIVKEYESIRNKIHVNDRLIETFEDTVKAIYKKWFSDFDFPDENGKPYKSSGGEMSFNARLENEIPSGWQDYKLSDLVNIKDGTHDSPSEVKIGYPLVTSTHLNPYSINLDETYNISEDDFHQTNKRSKVEKFDILFSMIGTIGLVNLVLYDEINFAIKNVALFKTSNKQELTEYILFYLKSPYLKQHIASNPSGSNQNYVTLEFLRDTPIFLPPKNILLRFKDIAEKLIRNIYLKNKENQILRSLQNLLLSKMATLES